MDHTHPMSAARSVLGPTGRQLSIMDASRQQILDHIRGELGAWAVCLIDSSTGMLMDASSQDGTPTTGNLDVIAIGCTDVVRSQQMLAAAMACSSVVEEIMIVMGDLFHFYRPLPSKPYIFLWAVLPRSENTLARTHLQFERLIALIEGHGSAPAALAG
ncbi:MAG TPA: hypothetical protein P5181_06755 [Dermatophilaceae bacterium]|nr:hypothetical protein [Dermatophilaceae bacterium]